jgi:hypothetical protein
MENRLPLRNKTTLCVQSSFFVPDRLGTLVLGIRFSTLSFFPTAHTQLASRTLLIAPLTRVKLLFQVCNAGRKPAYRFFAPVTTILHCYILIPGGKPASILSRRTSYRRMLQASILTNLVSPAPSEMVTVSRLAMRDSSANCADSPRDVQSPFQLPILGPLRLHLCPA